ncbi:hypothetical protein PMIN01_11773 [Paraphaeosphaeria minitans]|uniref:Uncharacterized protein n=1 Tax=Paraphaeosphaeria minitans TaxID=565426 RepID=A0A9P6G7G4_9PLEO|nr:hypothetical protein PMIN01_11773 [Paraphaeosphaeria minitans]
MDLQDCFDVVATQGAFLIPRARTPVFQQTCDDSFVARLERELHAVFTEQICRMKMYHGAADEWRMGHTPPEIREQRAAELKAQEEFEGQTSDTGSDNTEFGVTDTEVSPRNPVIADKTRRARKHRKSRQIEWLPSPPPSADSSLDISCTRKRRRTSEGDDEDAERFAGENSYSNEEVFPARKTALHNTSQQKNWKRRRVLEAGDREMVNVGRLGEDWASTARAAAAPSSHVWKGRLRPRPKLPSTTTISLNNAKT